MSFSRRYDEACAIRRLIATEKARQKKQGVQEDEAVVSVRGRPVLLDDVEASVNSVIMMCEQAMKGLDHILGEDPEDPIEVVPASELTKSVEEDEEYGRKAKE